MTTFNIDQNDLIQKKNEEVDRNRRAAYQEEADPLFFKSQRGEVDIAVWEQKIQEIKTRYPKY